MFNLIRQWFDTTTVESAPREASTARTREIDWPRIVPFIGVHICALGVFWVGFSWTALIVCIATYAVRMFGITAFYHRYCSHRAFATSRVVQFVGCALGNMAAQRGPLWWAAHHRKHHKHADTERDVHSPERDGLFWCHMGWWTDRRAYATDHAQVRDLSRFPELRLLDRFDTLAPIVLAFAVWGLGEAFAVWAPSLGTDKWQCLVWGFFVSTVLLYHATFTINSFAHKFGSRRYATKDHSRNNGILAVITLGEGWHNNHHHYPVAARQGFFWWEVDLTFIVLKVLAWFGLVRDLRPVPVEIRDGRPQSMRGAA